MGKLNLLDVEMWAALGTFGFISDEKRTEQDSSTVTRLKFV